MNEVKRYHVTEAGLVEGEALGRINVVLGSDYDVAVAVGTAFGNTLERVVAERDALQASIVRLNDKASCMSAHVLAYKLSRQRLLGRARARELLISELQQRLTAADERADVLEGLLRRVIDSGQLLSASSVGEALEDDIEAALKPAEGQRNQCDGCRAGIPIVNGAHRMGKADGYPDTMSCTAKLYRP